MSRESESRGILEFGPYRLDLDAELLQSGVDRIHLAPKSMALLSYLAQNPGRLITREELRNHLWGDSAVDHEQGLGFLIRQVRQALGDEAARPIYLETVPRKGFRFVAQVKPVGRQSSRVFRAWLAGALLAGVALAGWAVLVSNGVPTNVGLIVEGDTGSAEVRRFRDAVEEALSQAAGTRLTPPSAAHLLVTLSTETRHDSAIATARLSAGSQVLWRASAGGPVTGSEAIYSSLADDLARVALEHLAAGGGRGQVEVEKTVGEPAP